MNSRLRVTSAFYISLAAIIGFIIIAGLVLTDRIAPFDRAIIDFVQGFESPGLTSAAKFLAFIGSGVPVGVISLVTMLLLYLILKHRRELVFFLVAVGGAGALNAVLKTIFKRERPSFHRILEETGFSFPSGHAMAAFALYGAIAFLLWRHISSGLGRTLLIIFSTVMILAIGVSRIYAGVHFPSDILGGFILSGAWLTFCIWWFQWYMERSYVGSRSRSVRHYPPR